MRMLRSGEQLAQWYPCLLQAWAPTKDTGCAYKFKNLNMKIKIKINFIRLYLGLIFYPIKASALIRQASVFSLKLVRLSP
jgi:hypothetical protein